MATRVVIAAGGTAGHVVPALCVADALRERGAEVDVVALYETVAERLGEGERDALRGADYVTFTSSSTVRYLLEAAEGPQSLDGARLVSIGPVTSATLREHGLTPDVEAARHDVDGLVEALVEDAGRLLERMRGE